MYKITNDCLLVPLYLIDTILLWSDVIKLKIVFKVCAMLLVAYYQCDPCVCVIKGAWW